MRQRVFLVASLLMIAASLPRAQTSTAAGVDAFIRGDYQRAADILKPIVEQSTQPDHVAEFFMAALYETGRGVPVDAIRACALYTRVSFDHSSPFGTQAAAFVPLLLRSLGTDASEDCNLLFRVGFVRRFEPVTFTLDPGYWIAWDLKGATITYEGKEKRRPMPFAMNGAVFFPVQHTELEVGRSRLTRRHFIEVFQWARAKDKDSWTLYWMLFEVVRDDLIIITGAPTVTISALEPPTGPPFDVREVVTLRVNDNGDPEWAVLAGSLPRTAVIESEAEREEVRQLARARNTAEGRVDWARVRDIHRAPTLTYADAEGCGQVFVYGWSGDRTEAIAVHADKDLLQLSTRTKTFDVAMQTSGLELVLHLYEQPVRSSPFCTDVGYPPAQEETWHATRGTVTIELSPPGIRVNAPFLYRAMIRIVGTEFVNGAGVRVKQGRPITLTAIVGGIAW
jgi:hypothetical protein